MPKGGYCYPGGVFDWLSKPSHSLFRVSPLYISSISKRNISQHLLRAVLMASVRRLMVASLRHSRRSRCVFWPSNNSRPAAVLPRKLSIPSIVLEPASGRGRRSSGGPDLKSEKPRYIYIYMYINSRYTNREPGGMSFSSPPSPSKKPQAVTPPTQQTLRHKPLTPQRHILPLERIPLFPLPLLTTPRRLPLADHKVPVHVLDALAEDEQLVGGLGAVVAAERRDELGQVTVAPEADVGGVFGEVFAEPG